MNKILDNTFAELTATRELFNGTSFRISEWNDNTFYAHDEQNIDFIAYHGSLLYCKKSHWSDEYNKPVLLVNEFGIATGIQPNQYWSFIFGGANQFNEGVPTLMPKLKIENGDWYISYDEGLTWTNAGQATGNTGASSDFKGVEFKIEGDNLYYKLTGTDDWHNLGRVVGKDGEKGEPGEPGQPGENIIPPISVSKMNTWFCINRNRFVAPDDGDTWIDEAPTADLENGEYLWSKTCTEYSDGTSDCSPPICIGANGLNGRGIKNVIEWYCQHNSYKNPPENGVWVKTCPIVSKDYYIWTKLEIIFDDGTSIFTHPICSSGLSGPSGKDATGYHVELSNDSEQIYIYTEYTDEGVESKIAKDQTITTRLELLKNDTRVSLNNNNNIEIGGVDSDDYEIKDGVLYYSKSYTKGESIDNLTDVTFFIKVYNQIITKTLKLYIKESEYDYDLICTPGVIEVTQDNITTTPTLIGLKIKRTVIENGTWEMFTPTARFTIEYEILGCGTKGTISDNTLNIDPNVNVEGVILKLFIDGEEYDEEYIGVIKEGPKGDGSRYVYKLTESLVENIEDFKPTFEGGYFPEDPALLEGWTENPSGTNADWPFEYEAVSYFKNGQWGEWSTSLHSKYGFDGTSEEWAYRLTEDENAPTDEPDWDEDAEANHVVTPNRPWTDDPQTLSKNCPYQWEVVRRRIKEDWGNWSAPALHSRWAEDGITTYYQPAYYLYENTESDNPADNPVKNPERSHDYDYYENGWKFFDTSSWQWEMPDSGIIYMTQGLVPSNNSVDINWVTEPRCITAVDVDLILSNSVDNYYPALDKEYKPWTDLKVLRGGKSVKFTEDDVNQIKIKPYKEGESPFVGKITEVHTNNEIIRIVFEKNGADEIPVDQNYKYNIVYNELYIASFSIWTRKGVDDYDLFITPLAYTVESKDRDNAQTLKLDNIKIFHSSLYGNVIKEEEITNFLLPRGSDPDKYEITYIDCDNYTRYVADDSTLYNIKGNVTLTLTVDKTTYDAVTIQLHVNGEPGADGNGYIFKYRRFENQAKFTEYLEQDWGSDTLEGTEWTDNAQGVAPDAMIEAQISYFGKKTSSDVIEKNEWTPPTVWSSWGIAGADGDGIEYMFKITSDGVPAKPTGDDPEEWEDNGWYDDPQTVEFGETQYVSIRKRSELEWSTPAYWNSRSIDTKQVNYFAEISNDQNYLNWTVLGGDYWDPKPTITLDSNNNPVEVEWKDSPNLEYNGLIVMVSAPFSSDGIISSSYEYTYNDKNYTKWNGPMWLSDSNTFQIEYGYECIEEGKEFIPVGTKEKSDIEHTNVYLSKFNGDEESWRDDNPKFNWSDTPQNPKWMITSNKDSTGKWSDWAIFQVKGDAGNDGKSGTSPYVIDLSNDVDQFFYVNGKAVEDQTVTTTATLHLGDTSEKCYWKLNGNTVGNNTPYYEAIFSIYKGDIYKDKKIEHTITAYSDPNDITPLASKTFKILCLEGSVDYDIVVSDTYFKTNSQGNLDEDRELIIKVRKKKVGLSSNEGFVTDLSSENLTLKMDSENLTLTNGECIIEFAANTSIKPFTIYLYNGETTIDSVYIDVISDGKDADAAYYLSLSEDASNVFVDGDGKVLSEQTVTVYPQVKIGNEDCESWTYSIDGETCTLNNKNAFVWTFNEESGLIKDKYLTKTIVANNGNIEVRKNFKIYIINSSTDYDLIVSPNVVQCDDKGYPLEDTEIYLTVVKKPLTGGVAENIQELGNGIEITCNAESIEDIPYTITRDTDHANFVLKVNGVTFDSQSVKFVAKGSKGDTGYQIMLSNDVDQVFTKNDKIISVINPDGQLTPQMVETYVELSNGSSLVDVSNGEYYILLPDEFEYGIISLVKPNSNSKKWQVIVTFGSNINLNSNIEIPITITRNGSSLGTKVFKIIKIAGYEDYDIINRTGSIKRSATSSGWSYEPSTIEMSINKRKISLQSSIETLTTYDETITFKYQVDNGTECPVLNDSGDGWPDDGIFTLDVTTLNPTKFVKLNLYKKDETESETLVDYEIISIVSDGADGADGVSPVTITLDYPSEDLYVDESYKLYDDVNNKKFTISGVLKQGDTLLTGTEIKLQNNDYFSANSPKTNDEGRFTLTVTVKNNVTTINPSSIMLTIEGNTAKCDFKVYIIRSNEDYDVSVTPDIITCTNGWFPKDNGSPYEPVITKRCYKKQGVEIRNFRINEFKEWIVDTFGTDHKFSCILDIYLSIPWGNNQVTAGNYDKVLHIQHDYLLGDTYNIPIAYKFVKSDGEYEIYERNDGQVSYLFDYIRFNNKLLKNESLEKDLWEGWMDVDNWTLDGNKMQEAAKYEFRTNGYRLYSNPTITLKKGDVILGTTTLARTTGTKGQDGKDGDDGADGKSSVRAYVYSSKNTNPVTELWDGTFVYDVKYGKFYTSSRKVYEIYGYNSSDPSAWHTEYQSTDVYVSYIDLFGVIDENNLMDTPTYTNWSTPQIADLNFLSNIFGSENVNNNYAVTLSKVIGVTDTLKSNTEIVAGITNGITLKDGDTIVENPPMFFAGAKSLFDANDAAFTVYKDGSVTASKLSLTGGSIKIGDCEITEDAIKMSGDITVKNHFDITNKLVGGTPFYITRGNTKVGNGFPIGYGMLGTSYTITNDIGKEITVILSRLSVKESNSEPFARALSMKGILIKNESEHTINLEYAGMAEDVAPSRGFLGPDQAVILTPLTGTSNEDLLPYIYWTSSVIFNLGNNESNIT